MAYRERSEIEALDGDTIRLVGETRWAHGQILGKEIPASHRGELGDAK